MRATDLVVGKLYSNTIPVWFDGQVIHDVLESETVFMVTGIKTYEPKRVVIDILTNTKIGKIDVYSDIELFKQEPNNIHKADRSLTQ